MEKLLSYDTSNLPPRHTNLLVKERNGFRYIDEGKGEILLLLHGLFGNLSNWSQVVDHFKTTHRVIIPIMPLTEMPMDEACVEGLTVFIEEFTETLDLDSLTLIGNSLGGHIALLYTLNNPHKVSKLILTGSSGIYENTMGGTYPKRGTYDYIKERVSYTFYNPSVATKELVDEVFEITQSAAKSLRIIGFARSAQKNYLGDELKKIKTPTLLVWGLDDKITPPEVGIKFSELIPDSTLVFIKECGHAPMMEQPLEFNQHVEAFLQTKKSGLKAERLNNTLLFQ
jgi:pimeloyl-ACP methyl ester carboxylesterase